ncbi:uncharacterized protein LOC142341599 [Convolutriloba macropyga]|uniref:uncharacterized protein LOC142341599 n=1 Tax=Convolutriloba macropyga TaxID=536237 RepID=UPI003F5208F1
MKILHLIFILKNLALVTSLRVVEPDICHEGLYFNEEKNECEYCLRCEKGFQPRQPCSLDDTSTECEVCPVGTYSDRENSWVSCRRQTLCSDRHRTLHAAGNSVRDNTCGSCLAGYTEMEISGTEMCVGCNIVENPPPECEGYIEVEEDKDKEEVTKDDSESTEKPVVDEGNKGAVDGNGGGNGGTNDNELMLLLLVIVFGFFLFVAVFVLIALIIIRVARRDASEESALNAICPLSSSIKKNRKGSGTATEQKPGHITTAANDTIVLPEVIVAQHPGRNMYSRQLSDTIVQLKLFELKPSDIVASAHDTTSNEDLLELLSARSPDEQIKWKVHMVHKIYGDAQTWSLEPEVKQKLTRYFLSLEKPAQVQLGRAFLDIFKIDAHNKKLKMDELVKLVMNNSETTVYKLVLSTFQNCMDLRVVDAICDELFTSRKRAQQNINLDTIMEATA